jgi:hypothetical protein
MSSARPKSKVIDAGLQRVGAVYAKALLGASEKAGQTDVVLEELGSLVALLDELPDFDEVLRTPRIAYEDKVRLLERVLGGKVSPLLLNFVKVISQHERLDALRAIERAARKLFNQLRYCTATSCSRPKSIPTCSEASSSASAIRSMTAAWPASSSKCRPSRSIKPLKPFGNR